MIPREDVERMAARLGSAPLDITVGELDSAATMLRNLVAERDAALAALRTAAGLANEMTWKASTRPFADRLANIIRDGFTARAALKGPTP